MKFQIIIESDEPEGFHAYCPELKGIHVGGNTYYEALHTVLRAMALHITSMKKHGDWKEPTKSGVGHHLQE